MIFEFLSQKLLSNSLYGKTIENADNRLDVKFNFCEEMAMARFRCPSFKAVVFFEEENTSATFHTKKSAKMNQSWAVG